MNENEIEERLLELVAEVNASDQLKGDLRDVPENINLSKAKKHGNLRAYQPRIHQKTPTDRLTSELINRSQGF